MPARRKPKKHFRADAFRAREEELKQARRGMCSWLKFWKYCGHKKCKRAQGCVDDVDDCFKRFWPVVPEWVKVCIRAAGKAQQAKLSPPETKAAIERELTRWNAFVASEEARQAANQAAAEPAPPSPPIAPAPIARAPNPRASGPRIRVL